MNSVDLNRTQLNPNELNRTQLYSIEPNRTQSNPIKRLIWFDWPNFFVRVRLRLITELNRTQSRDWDRLGPIKFD